MQEIKFCPHCGHPNNGDVKFCEKCGYPLEEKDEIHPFSDEKSKPTEDGTPVVEKTTYQSLNYSQALRSLLFTNPVPLFSGLFFFVIITADILFNYFTSDGQWDVFATIGVILFFCNLFYLFKYLIIDPLRASRQFKHCEIHQYKVSFFKDKIHYQLSMNFKGQEVRNDFYLLYQNLFKFKEYKDMMILGFIVEGQAVPLCLLKDEYYDKIIPFLQKRIDEIKESKKR